jgi:hypothetical protein
MPRLAARTLRTEDRPNPYYQCAISCAVCGSTRTRRREEPKVDHAQRERLGPGFYWDN